MARNKEPWRRDRILDAAMEVLATGRSDQLKIADVAAAAGVSPPSVHYHFGDLNSLVLAAMGRASDEMFRARQDAVEDLTDPVAKLRTMIALGVPDVASPALVIMYTAIGLIRVNAAAIRDAQGHVGAQVSLYESIFEAGAEEGVFSPKVDPRSIAVNLVAMEDAFDLYLVLGIDVDGARGRAQLHAYADSVLFSHVAASESPREQRPGSDSVVG